MASEIDNSEVDGETNGEGNDEADGGEIDGGELNGDEMGGIEVMDGETDGGKVDSGVADDNGVGGGKMDDSEVNGSKMGGKVVVGSEMGCGGEGDDSEGAANSSRPMHPTVLGMSRLPLATAPLPHLMATAPPSSSRLCTRASASSAAVPRVLLDSSQMAASRTPQMTPPLLRTPPMLPHATLAAPSPRPTTP